MQVQRPQAVPMGLSSGFGGQSEVRHSKAQTEFLEYARMTPAERIRASILATMGLDEATVQAMDARDRELVEERVRAKIREAVEKKMAEDGDSAGLMVDIRA